MASYLAYLNVINLPVSKSYTVNERANPFDELNTTSTKSISIWRRLRNCYCFPKWTVTLL